MRKARAPKKRAYNNTSRLKKTEGVSNHIIQTLIKLLAENKGGEIPFKDLAKKSKVPLRTIFRLFKDKQALHEETERYLSGILQTSMSKLNALKFLDFAKSTFGVYDEYENLSLAYLFSPFGQQSRNILRKGFNKLLQDQILAERKIKLNSESQKKLAIAISIVSAKIWYDVRTDYGYSGKEIGESVAWTLDTLLGALEREYPV